MAPNPMTGTLTNLDTYTKVRWPCDCGGRDLNNAAISQGLPLIASNQPEGRRGKEVFSPRDFGGNMTILTLLFCTSSLSNYE